MSYSLSDLRREYQFGDFVNVHANPFVQFLAWLDDACKANILDPNAMILSTVSLDGGCSSRVILLKDVIVQGEDGYFSFFTNYESRKGKELDANPHASLCFFWDKLGRQVNIRGKVERLSREESELYFHSRPRDSQLGALASKQSRTLENRNILEQRFKSLKIEYENKTIPLPPSWGGYNLRPVEIHFWQGRISRLHDRILFTRFDNKETIRSIWKIERLYP